MIDINFTLTFYYLPGFKSDRSEQCSAKLPDYLDDEIFFRIVKTCCDMNDAVSHSRMTSGVWHSLDKVLVYYIGPEQCNPYLVARLLGTLSCGVFYTNRFFDPRFMMLLLLAYYFQLAPQTATALVLKGEFSAGEFDLKD